MKFRVQRDRPVRRVIRKLFAFHLQRCRALLTGTDPAQGRIHEVRKSVKRLRALVSLVADGLGDQRKWIDRQLRDVNRQLSAVRDAESLREAFDRLVTADECPPDEFAAVRSVLWSDTDRMSAVPAAEQRAVLKQLDRIEQRWKHIRLAGHGWSLLEDNIRRAWRNCRRAAASLPAAPTASELHELRKCVKQTQYHWDFLQPIAPETMAAELQALEAFSDALGQHHDYELLKEWTDRQHLDADLRKLVSAAIDRQQAVLEQDVLTSATALFAESPKQVCRRLHDHWQRWRNGAVATPPKNATSLPVGVAQNVGS